MQPVIQYFHISCAFILQRAANVQINKLLSFCCPRECVNHVSVFDFCLCDSSMSDSAYYIESPWYYGVVILL